MRKFWSWIRDDGGGRVLRLEGPIDEESFWSDGVTPKAFREDLYAEDGDVTIYIHSPGGNVFAAAEIYTMIRDYPGNVTVKIDAIAASAASVVAMAGDRVMMSPVAMLVIHDPMTIAMGNSKAMEKAISTLNEIKESIVNAYQAKTGLSRNKIAKLMSDETWLNAKKAVELGFADEIMFDDKKTVPKAEPDEQGPGEQDGDDTPEEGENGEVRLEGARAADALEGLLYSTRTMGQAILNSIGAFDEGKTSDEGPAQDDGDAPDSEAPVTNEEPVQTEGSMPEAVTEEAPEGGAEPVAENTAAEEAPVSDRCNEEKAASEEDKIDPDEDESDPDEHDSDRDEPDPDEDNPDKDKPDPDEDDPDEVDPDEDKPDPDEKEQKAKPVPSNVLPEGFIAIDQNGRTEDGSVPYIFLKNQLDRMR